MIMDGLDGDDCMARRIEGGEMYYKELLRRCQEGHVPRASELGHLVYEQTHK